MSISPVYVISAGRAETCLTPGLLEADGVPFKIVTEPGDDEAAYASRFGADRVLAVDEPGGGVTYARTWTKRHSESEGEDFHWQVDDDVKSFSIEKDRKQRKVGPAEAMAYSDGLIRRLQNAAILSISPSQWAESVPYVFNRYAHSVEVIRNGTPLYFRPNVIEDLDFCLQAFALGFCTVVVKQYRFASHMHLEQEGGCTEWLYGTGVMDRWVKNTIRRWRLPAKMERTKQGIARIDMRRVWAKYRDIPVRGIEKEQA
jgi:hypothetical protein